MGWWSEDIMGGDTPLDFQGSIYEKLGSNWQASQSEKKRVFDQASAKTLAELIPTIVTQWGCGEPGEDFHTNETSIGYQVLAVEMMGCGSPISDSLKADMLQWIPLDGWSQEDEDRKAKITELVEKLNSYHSFPISIESKGLMEVFQERVAKNS